MKILVTTPTGNIGRKMVPELLAPEFSVRVIVRDPDRLPAEIREQVEVIRGSIDDAPTLRRALDGVEALFWCVPSQPLQETDARSYYERFSGHDDFSLERYLEAAANDGKFETAQVRFKPETMDRVRREWSCRLVEEKADREGVVVTLLAYSLDWLAGWIFSFGGTAEVLAPERLRQLVRAEAERVAAKYATRRRIEARPQLLKNLLT